MLNRVNRRRRYVGIPKKVEVEKSSEVFSAKENTNPYEIEGEISEESAPTPRLFYS